MSRMLILAAMTLLLVAKAGGRVDEKKDVPKPDPDLKLLQGKWKISYHESAGEKDTPDNLWEIEVKGDRYTLSADNTTNSGTLRLDSSKTPKQLEYTVEYEDGKATTYHGIYELDGDTYRTCDVEKAVDPRPTAFKTKAKTGQIATWKKIKLKD